MPPACCSATIRRTSSAAFGVTDDAGRRPDRGISVFRPMVSCSVTVAIYRLLNGRMLAVPRYAELIRPRRLASSAGCSCFSWKFLIAALIASSASTEQWTFTGGSDNSSTIAVFLIAIASSIVLPLSHSVARLLEAMARAAAEGLEPGVLDQAGGRVDLDLQLDHVAALRGADQAGADGRVRLVEAADVARVVVVVEDLVAVCHCSMLLASAIS